MKEVKINLRLSSTLSDEELDNMFDGMMDNLREDISDESIKNELEGINDSQINSVEITKDGFAIFRYNE